MLVVEVIMFYALRRHFEKWKGGECLELECERQRSQNIFGVQLRM